MILFHTDEFVPHRARIPFRVYQGFLALGIITFLYLLFSALLFPTTRFSYSYEDPMTDTDSLETPKGLVGDVFDSGNVPAEETLRTYAGVFGDISFVSVTATLDRQTEMPKTIPLTIRRSYRSFFFSEGDPVEAVPEARVLAIDGKPYLLSDEALRPLLGERAALSWTSADEVLPAKSDALDLFPLNDTPVGFRPGTLVSDEAEIFAIDGKERIRPIETLPIFESLGFRAENVISVEHTELSAHSRGPTLSAADPQPEGTLLFDRSTGRHFIIESETRRNIESEKYLDILLHLTSPITVTSDAFHTPLFCELVPHPTFRDTYRCEVPTDVLAELPGNSYEFTLTPENDIRIRHLSVAFRQTPNQSNLAAFFRSAKASFLETYGRGPSRL